MKSFKDTENLRGKIMIIVGTMLFLSALFLAVYNILEDRKGGEVSGEILSKLKIEMGIPPDGGVPVETIKEGDYGIPENDLFEDYERTVPKEEKLIEIDGRYYIGIISIPLLNIELPVASEWSYDNLKMSPCRYKGSVYEDNMIIAAHNYSSHFGGINQLNTGDIITFTDGWGDVYTYELLQTEIIDGYDIDAMDFGTGWDLTLFTCTLSGQSRVTVRATRVDKDEK